MIWAIGMKKRQNTISKEPSHVRTNKRASVSVRDSALRRLGFFSGGCSTGSGVGSGRRGGGSGTSGASCVMLGCGDGGVAGAFSTTSAGADEAVASGSSGFLFLAGLIKGASSRPVSTQKRRRQALGERQPMGLI